MARRRDPDDILREEGPGAVREQFDHAEIEPPREEPNGKLRWRFGDEIIEVPPPCRGDKPPPPPPSTSPFIWPKEMSGRNVDPDEIVKHYGGDYLRRLMDVTYASPESEIGRARDR